MQQILPLDNLLSGTMDFLLVPLQVALGAINGQLQLLFTKGWMIETFGQQSEVPSRNGLFCGPLEVATMYKVARVTWSREWPIGDGQTNSDKLGRSDCRLFNLMSLEGHQCQSFFDHHQWTPEWISSITDSYFQNGINVRLQLPLQQEAESSK